MSNLTRFKDNRAQQTDCFRCYFHSSWFAAIFDSIPFGSQWYVPCWLISVVFFRQIPVVVLINKTPAFFRVGGGGGCVWFKNQFMLKHEHLLLPWSQCNWTYSLWSSSEHFSIWVFICAIFHDQALGQSPFIFTYISPSHKHSVDPHHYHDTPAPTTVASSQNSWPVPLGADQQEFLTWCRTPSLEASPRARSCLRNAFTTTRQTTELTMLSFIRTQSYMHSVRNVRRVSSYLRVYSPRVFPNIKLIISVVWCDAPFT